MKNFKNLKQIKNRDEYIKLCELNYANTFLEVTGQNEVIERILPTEIINPNLENKFTDIRGLSKSGKIIIIEGHEDVLRDYHLIRYYGYHKDTSCDFSKNIKFIIACLSDGNNQKRLMAEENICFKPIVLELKKIKADKYLNRLRTKFKKQMELDRSDCGILVHIPV